MLTINPRNLRKLRERKGLSLDELGAMAKIDRGTISKIENAKRTECRPSTTRKLADALNVETEILVGPDIHDADDEPSFFARKSQLNFKMADDARNALNLVAMRYNVRPAAILHLAPFLFYWAAESSLRSRQQQIDEIDRQLEVLNSVGAPQHLSGLVTNNWRGDEVLDEERQSISKRDLFGDLLSDDAIRVDYESSEHNPMVQFLQSIAKSLGGMAEFEYWTPRTDYFSYTIAREDALAIVGGNEEAADHIIHGRVRLHEMPKEIREGTPKAAADWAMAEGQKTIDQFEFDIIGVTGGGNG